MATSKKSNKPSAKKDHPDQAVDTDLPDDTVNEDAFRALQHEAWAAMEGLTEEDVL